MANKLFSSPIKGVSEALDPAKQFPLSSGYMNNVRAVDVLEKQIRIGQRPGLDKVFDQQIGGVTSSIVFLGVITTVD